MMKSDKISQYGSKWKKVKELGASGQCFASIVTPLNEAEGNCTKYFLKELRENNSSERRKRMYREVYCYKTLDHCNIPKLIDTNVERYLDNSISLYIVTEFIDGKTLTNFCDEFLKDKKMNHQEISNTAIDLVCNLLETLKYIHSEEVVHRDIKPDNIMFRNNDKKQLVLVDFGLGYIDETTANFQTETCQEIGNRFLKLQEFLMNSSHKRDPRSDVTQCVGILFYLLTGIRPISLFDHENLKPHQREEARQKLRALKNIDIMMLLNIFDRGFEPTIHARWSSAEELRKAIEMMKSSTNTERINLTEEEYSERILAIMDSHNEKIKEEISKTLDHIGRIMIEARSLALSDLGNRFNAITSGPTKFVPKRRVTTCLGIVQSSDHSVQFFPQIHGDLEGNEIIIHVEHPSNSKVLYRCEKENFRENVDHLKKILKKYLLEGLYELMSK